MRWLAVPAAALVSAALLFAQVKPPPPPSFGRDAAGKPLTGWKADRTGAGEGSVWKFVADATAPSKEGTVLTQTAEGPRAMFNLFVAEDTRYTNVEITAAVKAVKGKVDQGGGFVWRYQDADNYYVARLNPLEFNYRVYKVVAGKRIQLETKEEVTAPAGVWHTLKVRHAGDHIECFLNGKKLLEAKDDTIRKAGKVGLWTKADAQTSFDSFQVREVAK